MMWADKLETEHVLSGCEHDVKTSRIMLSWSVNISDQQLNMFTNQQNLIRGIIGL